VVPLRRRLRYSAPVSRFFLALLLLVSLAAVPVHAPAGAAVPIAASHGAAQEMMVDCHGGALHTSSEPVLDREAPPCCPDGCDGRCFAPVAPSAVAGVPLPAPAPAQARTLPPAASLASRAPLAAEHPPRLHA
jgi:hypothetical protein